MLTFITAQAGHRPPDGRLVPPPSWVKIASVAPRGECLVSPRIQVYNRNYSIFFSFIFNFVFSVAVSSVPLSRRLPLQQRHLAVQQGERGDVPGQPAGGRHLLGRLLHPADGAAAGRLLPAVVVEECHTAIGETVTSGGGGRGGIC